MCRSIDAAVSMINKSIDLAIEREDNRYYIDNVKLHKLLYLAQCHTLCFANKLLFTENIEAHHCGPVVHGIELIAGKCGFTPITKKLNPAEFGTADVPLSHSRAQAVNDVLERYGTYSTESIVEFIKNSNAYSSYNEHNILHAHPNIARDDLTKAGNEFFG